MQKQGIKQDYCAQCTLMELLQKLPEDKRKEVLHMQWVGERIVEGFDIMRFNGYAVISKGNDGKLNSSLMLIDREGRRYIGGEFRRDGCTFEEGVDFCKNRFKGIDPNEIKQGGGAWEFSGSNWHWPKIR